VLLSHAWFTAAAKHSTPLPVLAGLAGFVASIFGGVFAGIVADLFPTRLRFSGIAVSFNISFSVASGIAALTATALVRSTGDPASASWYMIVCAGIALAASLVVPRYAGHIGRD
jgi:MFS family permease